MKTTKQNLVIFFGVAVMLVGVLINGILFRTFSKYLVDVGQLPKVAMWSALFNLIGGVGLLFMTMKGQIRRGFHILLPIHVAFLIAYLLGASGINPVYGTLFYFWGNFFVVALTVLVWGYANQIFQFRSAALFYPLLGIIGAVFINTFLMNFLIYFYHNFTLQIIVMTLGAGLTYTMFLFLSSMELGTKDTGRKIFWGYWLALALFVMGVKFAPQFQKILFKWQTKQLFPNALEYSQFMGEYSYQILMVSIFGVLGSVGLGILLYFKGSKWWGGVSTTLMGCVLITGFVYFYSSHTVTLSETSISLFSKESAFMGQLIMMLMGLKELAYFAIPLDKRFTAKCLIDIIVLTLSGVFATQITTLIYSGGEIGSQVILLGALCIGGFLIALVGILRIGSDFRKAPKIAT